MLWENQSSPQLRAGQFYLLRTAQAANASGQEFFGPTDFCSSQCMFMQELDFPFTRSCAWSYNMSNECVFLKNIYLMSSSTKSWCSPFADRQSPAPTPGTAWRLPKLGKKDVPLIVHTKKAEFTGHRDTWQNPQDKDEINKTTTATVLNQLQLHKKQFWQGQIIIDSWSPTQKMPQPKRREWPSIWTNEHGKQGIHEPMEYIIQIIKRTR